MIKSSPEDRRQSKRYDLPLKINYRDPITYSTKDTFAKNIAKNGLRFVVSGLIPKNTVLDIWIESPYGGASIPSKAKIVWAKKFITGDDAEDVVYEAGAKLIKKIIY